MITSYYPCERCRKQPGTMSTALGWYCDECQKNHAEEIRSTADYRRRCRVEYYRRMSEIGARFMDRTFANYRVTSENTTAYFAAKKAAEDYDGLYLYGPPGNGKTYLAAAIVNQLAEQCMPAIFTTEGGLLAKIRDTYTNKGNLREGESDIVKHYADVPILVLDDIGTEPFTANTARLFYALINRRYENDLPLIVTANVSLADLAIQWRNSGVDVHVGTKICDRMREMCQTFVKIEAKSERGKK